MGWRNATPAPVDFYMAIRDALQEDVPDPLPAGLIDTDAAFTMFASACWVCAGRAASFASHGKARDHLDSPATSTTGLLQS